MIVIFNGFYLVNYFSGFTDGLLDRPGPSVALLRNAGLFDQNRIEGNSTTTTFTSLNGSLDLKSRVTRGKTPRFQDNIIFSQKLLEIFQLYKVHVFTKLLGHILTFKTIIFHI